MIVVKVELWPGGIEARARELARLWIANDGSGSATRGNYQVAVMKKGDARAPWRHGNGKNEVGRPIRIGHVDDHARSSNHVLILVAKAIAATFPAARKASNAAENLDLSVSAAVAEGKAFLDAMGEPGRSGSWLAAARQAIERLIWVAEGGKLPDDLAGDALLALDLWPTETDPLRAAIGKLERSGIGYSISKLLGGWVELRRGKNEEPRPLGDLLVYLSTRVDT